MEIEAGGSSFGKAHTKRNQSTTADVVGWSCASFRSSGTRSPFELTGVLVDTPARFSTHKILKWHWPRASREEVKAARGRVWKEIEAEVEKLDSSPLLHGSRKGCPRTPRSSQAATRVGGIPSGRSMAYESAILDENSSERFKATLSVCVI